MRNFKNTWSEIAIEDQLWRHRVQPNQSLVIEIGAGVGYHPLQYAYNNQDKFIIAIERTHIKAQKMLRGVESSKDLNNIHAIHADAIEWICRNIQANEVDEYFILYPNPYPKAKQANKRFMNMPFMQTLIQTLKDGGKLTLATNMDFYYQEAKDIFCNVWGLNLIEDTVLTDNFPARTHFEKKYIERGESCFNLVFCNS